ncbi:MAG: hypothetical protein EBZ59_08945 [Planctomycetia bacterium]|nr:hypothetical protein [Planctomycetia bacterium]
MDVLHTLFRGGAGRREHLLPPASGRLARDPQTFHRAGVGAITSRRVPLREWWEREAFAKGVSVAELKRRKRA